MSASSFLAREPMVNTLTRSAVTGIETLNSGCYCISLDSEALRREIESHADTRDIYPAIMEKAPHMFAATPVFVSRHHLDQMARIVRAAETVIALPAWREAVLERAPRIARHDPRGPRGVFLSFDFHLGAAGPQLIEINTNAGGALLNAALARAQQACCADMERMSTGPVPVEALEETFFGMFAEEWRLARGNLPMHRIAIVDEHPQEQYLYPEFLLFRQLFRRRGMDAVIIDPSELRWQGGVLLHEDRAIDLVYNRLTDFALEAPAHAALREAYLANGVVLTPHPRAHALYADKRNLALLSDAGHLCELGVGDEIASLLLAGIPATRIVRAEDAAQLWSQRRGLFFKPAAGFGSKAAYRGDKLTRRVWEDILAGDYVSQALVPPGERIVAEAGTGATRALKFDLRNYAYDGQVQFVTARLYQGQTTNFRTPGGGFAPVFTDVACACEDSANAGDSASTQAA